MRSRLWCVPCEEFLHALKDRHGEEGQKAALQDFSVKAVHALGDLLENCKSESVKLGCIKEILDRAGFKPVNRQEIFHMNEFENWNDEELRAELERLQTIH